MKASDILSLVPDSTMKGPDLHFPHLRANSRSVSLGDAFIALKGSVADGHGFIDHAVKAGAGLIIYTSGYDIDYPDVTTIEVPDSKKALEKILPVLFPAAARVKMIGITGTNGKTSTTYILESILSTAGINPGVIGTINIRYNGISTESSVTTPGPVELFEQLNTMGIGKVGACIMEVSSHSLDQERIMGLSYDCAVFTNLTQDHLDYHKDMETYFQAKRMLFGSKFLRGKAVINIDNEYGRRLIAEASSPITYGKNEKASICMRSLRTIPGGMILILATPLGEMNMRTHLMGEIYAYNIMSAVGAAIALGIDKDLIIRGVEKLELVPGRMEQIRNDYGLDIFVDYAHTPDALNHVLNSARSMTKGRLISIFGCGGDRDKTKRPIMGAIAASVSDLVIITSDNPRSEDPSAIIDDIVKGIKDMTYVSIEPDREEAIRLGIASMKEGDCLIIAGKGHENYQIIGDLKISFDDRNCVRKCLREIYGS